MCLRTCNERRRCRGNETTGVECDGKTWHPEEERGLFERLCNPGHEISINSKMGQNLELSINAFISLCNISLMKHNFNPQLISTLASSAHILYIPFLECAKNVCPPYSRQ